VVRDNVYHPQFDVSFSLKSDRPVLVLDCHAKGWRLLKEVRKGWEWESAERFTIDQFVRSHCNHLTFDGGENQWLQGKNCKT
jgi:hypothetical protein